MPRSAAQRVPGDRLVVAIDPGKVSNRVWLTSGERGLIGEPVSLPVLRDGVEELARLIEASGAGGPVIVDRGDRRAAPRVGGYPELSQLLGGYFHQDWDLDAATADEALEHAITQTPRALHPALERELDDVLAAHRDDRSLRAAVADLWRLSAFGRWHVGARVAGACAHPAAGRLLARSEATRARARPRTVGALAT